MVTLLRDHVAVTRQVPIRALAAASHPPSLTQYAISFAAGPQAFLTTMVWSTSATSSQRSMLFSRIS